MPERVAEQAHHKIYRRMGGEEELGWQETHADPPFLPSSCRVSDHILHYHA